MPVVKRDQTACSQGAQPQLFHHRRNGSQHLNFKWLQNLLETHSQTILLHLQNRTPFSRLIINQGFRLGNSCKSFFGYFSFFLLWSFWFQLENLKDSPSDSQLGKDMATFTVHLRCSGTPHLCEASQKTPICRVNMSPVVTRFCRWSRNGFLWRTEGWGQTHCLHFSLGWCTFSLKIECLGFLPVCLSSVVFMFVFEIEYDHVAQAGLTLAILRLQLAKLWNHHSPLIRSFEGSR